MISYAGRASRDVARPLAWLEESAQRGLSSASGASWRRQTPVESSSRFGETVDARDRRRQSSRNQDGSSPVYRLIGRKNRINDRESHAALQITHRLRVGEEHAPRGRDRNRRGCAQRDRPPRVRRGDRRRAFRRQLDRELRHDGPADQDRRRGQGFRRHALPGRAQEEREADEPGGAVRRRRGGHGGRGCRARDRASSIRRGSASAWGRGSRRSTSASWSARSSRAIGPDGTFDMARFAQARSESIFPLWLLQHLPNMAAAHISILHHAMGPNNTIVTACAAGTQAVGEAFRLIARGDADVMLAGGCDSRLDPAAPGGLLRHEGRQLVAPAALGGLPAVRCRARRLRPRRGGRGARSWRAIAGPSGEGRRSTPRSPATAPRSTPSASPGPSPKGKGAALSMTAALREARVDPSDIDYINAHGTSTRLNDLMETVAVKRVFGHRARCDPDELAEVDDRPPDRGLGRRRGRRDRACRSNAASSRRRSTWPRPTPTATSTTSPTPPARSRCGPPSPTASASAARTPRWSCRGFDRQASARSLAIQAPSPVLTPLGPRRRVDRGVTPHTDASLGDRPSRVSAHALQGRRHGSIQTYNRARFVGETRPPRELPLSSQGEGGDAGLGRGRVAGGVPG